MFEAKTYSRIVNEAIQKIVQSTNIESVEPGTVLRQLIEQQQLQVYELQRFVQLLADSTFLSEQTGPFLDTIATIFGLTRQPQQIVQSVGGIRFYTDSGEQIGNFLSKDYFVDNDVYVYDKFGGVYKVIQQSLPEHLLRYPYVTVSQMPITVATASIDAEDINTYSPSVAGVSVTNISRLTLIQPAESDEQLRYRIQSHLNSHRKATAQQLRLQQMSVPGVQDQQIIEFPRGTGSVDVYIIGVDINTDEQLIEPVREQVAQYVQAGIDVDVKTFVKTHVILGGIVRAQQNSAKDSVFSQIESVQRPAIDGIRPGDVLNKYSLLADIIRNCSLVKQIENFTIYTKQPTGYQIARALKTDVYKSLESEKLMLQPTNWHVFEVL